MAIPVNIEDLLHKRKIESTRIEFKKGWNPDKIYRTICAFANDIDNLGGGYIVVGVEEEDNTGIAKRPVTGVPVEELDKIQREMIGYNNKIDPYYMPRVDVLWGTKRNVHIVGERKTSETSMNKAFDAVLSKKASQIEM
ncbi:helix-turn-helix domain-containing protein [Bacteroides faecis]|uniref:AlbA family DNA-binding domain-containing protein n=1 Tax=Bacteroides faecis TaxID=674529 RepID=UPI003A5215F2